MVLVLFFSLFMWANEDVYVVILRDGKRMEVKQAPVFENGRAIIELSNGDKVALPEGMVDRGATKALNEEMAEVRKQEQRLAELKAEARRVAALEAAEARKPVVLDKAEDLPEYDDNANSVTGMAGAAEGAAVAAAADGVVQAGDQPYAKTFRSDEPVYVSAERRTKLPAGGYLVECDIKVNHVTGAENVVLTYKANFVTASAEQHTIQVEPKTIDYNQTVTVRFNLKTNDELFRTEHGLEAEIQE